MESNYISIWREGREKWAQPRQQPDISEEIRALPSIQDKLIQTIFIAFISLAKDMRELLRIFHIASGNSNILEQQKHQDLFEKDIIILNFVLKDSQFYVQHQPIFCHFQINYVALL